MKDDTPHDYPDAPELTVRGDEEVSETNDLYKKVACALAGSALLLFGWVLIAMQGMKDNQGELTTAVAVGFSELKGQINPIVQDVARVEGHVVRVDNRVTDVEKRVYKIEESGRRP